MPASLLVNSTWRCSAQKSSLRLSDPASNCMGFFFLKRSSGRGSNEKPVLRVVRVTTPFCIQSVSISSTIMSSMVRSHSPLGWRSNSCMHCIDSTQFTSLERGM